MKRQKRRLSMLNSLNMKYGLILLIMLCPIRPAFAVFALETTMQLMIMPELSSIKGAVAGVAPAIVKANTAIGRTIVSAMHELTQNYGLANAANKAIDEFGPQSVNPSICSNSQVATALYQNNVQTDRLSNDTSEWFESLLHQFPNRSRANFLTHRALKLFTVDRKTLMPRSDAYPTSQWAEVSAYNMFMLTPEPPTRINTQQRQTTAGQQHESYEKLYNGKLAYVNAAFSDDAAEKAATIALDDWISGSGSVIPGNLIEAMKRDERNLVKDPETNTWKLSKKSALQALSESRYGNAIWWEDVGQIKTTTWNQREQTMLAALQFETQLRILEKLEHLVRLTALNTQETAVEPMRSRLNKLLDTAKTQQQRDGR